VEHGLSELARRSPGGPDAGVNSMMMLIAARRENNE
jgi:hypothetical protein